jgi:hypothetical protein
LPYQGAYGVCGDQFRLLAPHAARRVYTHAAPA